MPPEPATKFFVKLYLTVFIQAMIMGFSFDCYNLGGQIVATQLQQANPSLAASFVNDATILGATLANLFGGAVLKKIGRFNTMILGNLMVIAGCLP